MVRASRQAPRKPQARTRRNSRGQWQDKNLCDSEGIREDEGPFHFWQEEQTSVERIRLEARRGGRRRLWHLACRRRLLLTPGSGSPCLSAPIRITGKR